MATSHLIRYSKFAQVVRHVILGTVTEVWPCGGLARVGLSLKVGYLSAPFWLGSWLGGVPQQSKNTRGSFPVRLVRPRPVPGPGQKPGQQNLRREIKIKNVSASFAIVGAVPKTLKKHCVFNIFLQKLLKTIVFS